MKIKFNSLKDLNLFIREAMIMDFTMVDELVIQLGQVYKDISKDLILRSAHQLKISISIL